MAAFWGGLVDKSERFLEHIGKVVAPIASCRQELVIAIRKQDWSRTLELLGDPEIDLYGQDSDVSPLHLACAHDFAQCVDYLIDSGVSVDLRDRKAQETPLHHAARGGHFRVCKHLVEKGASPALRNDKNQTPYDVATQLNLRQWLLPLQLHAEGEAEEAAAAALGPPPSAMQPPPTSMTQPSLMQPPVRHQPTPNMPGLAHPAPPPPAITQQQPVATAAQPDPAPPSLTQSPTMPVVAPQVPVSMPATQQPAAPSPPAVQQPAPQTPPQAPPPPPPPPPQAPPSTQQHATTTLSPVSFPVAASAPQKTERRAMFVPCAASKQAAPLRGSAPIRPVVFTPPVVRPENAAMRPAEPRTIFRPPPPPPQTEAAPAVDDSAPPRPAPRPYSKYNASSSLRNDKRDALGRYADGFHSSASDPVLAAKYGNNTTTNLNLPPPPTNIPPPPTQLATGGGYPNYARPGSTTYAAGGQYAAPPPLDFSEPPRPT